MCHYQFTQLPSVQIPLANQFYKRVYKKGVAAKNDQVFVIKTKTIICAAKLKKFNTDLLLTGVACDPQFRSQGLGSRLIKYVIQLQQQPIYCFPYAHLQQFYARLGFREIPAQASPELIKQRFSAYSKNRALLLMVYNG